jgi:uncharacterized membrane protein YhaH (DUF805 family)
VIPSPPPRPAAGWRWWALALGCAAAAGGVLLYWATPTEDSLYPRCPFHTLTGLHCPGCGTTRCLHALLHGDPAQALAYNPLAVLALPFLLAWLGRLGLAALVNRRLRGRPLPALWIRLIFVAIVVFWVLRNLPWFPFDLLAPHPL